MRMDLEDIRTFVSLATTRSFSQTAKELFLTQPGVTRRLQRLEHVIGASLVDRRRRPLVLTAAGAATLEHSQHVLDGLAALRAVGSGAAVAHREFRVGIAHALTEFALVSPLLLAREEFPRVAFLLSTGWSPDLVPMVRTGHLDAAFVLLSADEAAPRGVSCHQVATERLVAVAARRGTRPRTVRDLEGAEWILNPPGCAGRAALLEVLRKAQVRARISVETYTYETQLALVSRGRGLGLVPERLLYASRYRGELRRLGLPELHFPLRIWALHRPLPTELADPLRTLCDQLTLELQRASRSPRRGALAGGVPRAGSRPSNGARDLGVL
jgi:DNA-binding transcriptional LysR family regulator